MGVDLDAVNRATRVVLGAVHNISYAHYITPTNLTQVRTDFLDAHDAGRAVDPRFEYPPIPGEHAVALDAVRDVPTGAGPWREALDRELRYARAGLAALRSRDPEAMTSYSQSQFGDVAAAAVVGAYRRLGEQPPTAGVEATWSSDRVVVAMGRVLAELGLDDWTIGHSEHMAARMSVVGRRREVRVKRGATFTGATVRRLIVHEIGTHVLRTANGLRQPLHLLAHGIPGYLGTEEGLAVWHEQQADMVDPDVMRRYALRVIACDTALRAGFRAVFDAVLPHTTATEAFDLAVRVKRGLLDTSAPGGYIKDHIYLGGFIDVTNHLDRHPGDHDLLMGCKWPLSEVPLLRTLLDEQSALLPHYRVDEVVDLTRAVVAER
ncbi:tyrosine/phenylalanine carboxypeptidase domain-containing protein [Micromonospora sp. CA-259024]|uniref:tyrosine/phenylalanine carboxypeptidase domain-containing protein n=1 Tax=Micromonospora sp. CA-259024 TaxID=3239965 RepID=UPI003D8BA69B